MSVLIEITEARTRLGLRGEDAVAVPNDVATEVLAKATAAFVCGGFRHWWWEAFRDPSASLEVADGNGWRLLPGLAPDAQERVWFIAEDEELETFVVFDTTAEVASRIIGDCYAFEYYLLAKDFNWLICENHHNVLFVVGEAVVPRLIPAAG